MSTQREARAVLRKRIEGLRTIGAYAVQVESGRAFGSRGAVIVAWVPKHFAGRLPATVSATVRGKKVVVPVRTMEAP